MLGPQTHGIKFEIKWIQALHTGPRDALPDFNNAEFRAAAAEPGMTAAMYATKLGLPQFQIRVSMPLRDLLLAAPPQAAHELAPIASDMLC